MGVLVMIAGAMVLSSGQERSLDRELIINSQRLEEHDRRILALELEARKLFESESGQDVRIAVMTSQYQDLAGRLGAIQTILITALVGILSLVGKMVWDSVIKRGNDESLRGKKLVRED